MNSTNLTTRDVNSTADYNAQVKATLTSILNGVDIISRVVAFIAHTLYFCMVIFVKEMHKKGLLYLHQANLVNYIYILMFMFYIASEAPTFENLNLNAFLCTSSEIVWGLLKYLQAYSVLILSVYRAIACYYPILFKKINKSYLSISLPMVFIWCLAILLFVISKFAFGIFLFNFFCFSFEYIFNEY